MIRTLVFASVLFFTGILSAEELTFSRSNDYGSSIVTLHGENQFYYVTEYFIEPGSLQDIVSQKSFTTLEEARLYFQKEYEGYEDTRYGQEVFSSTEVFNQPLWEVRNQWNDQWEQKFNSWIEAEFDEEFFFKNNLATDCADAALALRWIFARNNNLPAANTLAGSGVLFTSHSMKREWKNLPRAQHWRDDRLFMAALNYLLANAYTHTLLIDTYPIEMAKGSFTEGTIYLSVDDISGHTRIVGPIDDSGQGIPIWIYSSTVPVQVRKLYKEPLLDSTFEDKPSDGGLVKMRWPVMNGQNYSLVPKAQMPTYSLEQYDKDFPTVKGHFMLTVIDRLGIQFIPKNIVTAFIQGIQDKISDRVSVVEVGYSFCRVNDCSEGTQNYENHSTPSRDKSIREGYVELRNLVYILEEVDSDIVDYMILELDARFVSVLGITKSMSFFEALFKYGLPSYHPEDTVEERWVVTGRDAFASLAKKLDRLNIVRNQMINASDFCRSTQNCERASENWKNNHSYDIDKEIKRLSNAVLTTVPELFPNSRAPADILEYVKRSLFFVSEPNSPKDQREGRHQKGFFVVKAESDYYQIEDTVFYLDKERVVDLVDGRVLLEVQGDHILIDDQNRQLVFLEDGSSGIALKIYDYKTDAVVDSVKLPSFRQPGKIWWISRSALIVQDPAEKTLWAFKVEKGQLRGIGMIPNLFYYFVYQDYHYKYRYSKYADGIGAVVKNTVGEVFYIRENNSLVEALPLDTIDPYADFVFKKNQVAIVEDDGRVVFNNFNSGTSCEIELDDVNYPRVDPLNYVISDFSSSETIFLDDACQKDEVFSDVHMGEVQGGQEGFVLSSLNGSGATLFPTGRDGARISIARGRHYSNAIKEGIVLTNYLSDKFEVIDFSGRILDVFEKTQRPVDCSEDFYSSGLCSPGRNFKYFGYTDENDTSEYQYRTLYLQSGKLIGTDKITRIEDDEWQYYFDESSLIFSGALIRASDDVRYYIPEP